MPFILTHDEQNRLSTMLAHATGAVMRETLAAYHDPHEALVVAQGFERFHEPLSFALAAAVGEFLRDFKTVPPIPHGAGPSSN